MQRITLIWRGEVLVGVVPTEDKYDVAGDLCGDIAFQDIEFGDYHDNGIYCAEELY